MGDAMITDPHADIVTSDIPQNGVTARMANAQNTCSFTTNGMWATSTTEGLSPTSECRYGVSVTPDQDEAHR